MKRSIVDNLAPSTVLALQGVLVAALFGSVSIEVLVLRWLFGQDVVSNVASQRFKFGAVAVLCLSFVEVAVVCVWRLLTIVRRGVVLPRTALRYVDIFVGVAAATSMLALWLCLVLAPGRAWSTYIVVLLAGAAVAAAGIALIGRVLRRLLVRAIARDVEVVHLRAELDAVI